MDLKFLKYEKRDHLAYISFNRPDVMNSIHPPTAEEMGEVLDDFIGDNNLWIGVVTGAGEKAFSAGNDLKYTASHSIKGSKPSRGGFGGFVARFDINKPLIAAVNGFALGGGFEVALACDIIIAADHARFGLPEPRVGLMAMGGGVHRLPRQIPLKIAMGMMLTGKHITAQEAHALGIVNEVVPLKELIPAAERWAAQIMECSPIAVQATKEAALRGLDMPLERAVDEKFPGLYKLLHSHDVVEGPRAFAEKRKPQWKIE
jgi:enoyl-CoA hydratase/carnithine racemase